MALASLPTLLIGEDIGYVLSLAEALWFRTVRYAFFSKPMPCSPDIAPLKETPLNVTRVACLPVSHGAVQSPEFRTAARLIGILGYHRLIELNAQSWSLRD